MGNRRVQQQKRETTKKVRKFFLPIKRPPKRAGLSDEDKLEKTPSPWSHRIWSWIFIVFIYRKVHRHDKPTLVVAARMLILGVRTVSVSTRKTQQRRGHWETQLSRPAARDFNPYYPLSPFEPILGIGQRGGWTGRDSRLNFQGEPPGRNPVEEPNYPNNTKYKKNTPQQTNKNTPTNNKIP